METLKAWIYRIFKK